MQTRDLKMSVEPINKRFPDATKEILEPLKLPSDDKIKMKLHYRLITYFYFITI